MLLFSPIFGAQARDVNDHKCLSTFISKWKGIEHVPNCSDRKKNRKVFIWHYLFSPKNVICYLSSVICRQFWMFHFYIESVWYWNFTIEGHLWWLTSLAPAILGPLPEATILDSVTLDREVSTLVEGGGLGNNQERYWIKEPIKYYTHSTQKEISIGGTFF